MESVTLEVTYCSELSPIVRAEDKRLPGLLKLVRRWVVWVLPEGGFRKGVIHCPVDNRQYILLMVTSAKQMPDKKFD
eukprot:4791147-Ditylum_brightwellii.AAC.1